MRITRTFTTGIRTELHSRPFFAMRFVLCYLRTSASLEARKGQSVPISYVLTLGFLLPSEALASVVILASRQSSMGLVFRP